MDYLIRKSQMFEKDSPEWLEVDDEIVEIFLKLEDLKPHISPEDAVNILIELHSIIDKWEMKD